MKTKSILHSIIIISSLLSFLLMAGIGYGAYCDDVQTNLTSGYPVVYNASNCPIAFGTYYVNATSSSTGYITIVQSNTVFDCNGATIRGNGTGYGIDSDLKNNITIKNCIINNYDRGMWIRRGNGAYVFNNTLNYSISSAIRITNFNNSFIYLNHVYNTSLVAGIIELQGNIINGSVYDNVIDKGYYGIRFFDNVTNGKAFRNNITNSVSTGIYVWDSDLDIINGTNVSDNYVLNSGRNGISLNGYNGYVYNNIVENYNHEGIDFHCDEARTTTNNFNVYNNLIFQSDNYWSMGEWGISLLNIQNSNIYNNTIRNLINTTIDLTQGRGILVSSGDFTKNLNIFNNTILNISGNCFYTSSLNISWYSNTFSDCYNEVATRGSTSYLTNYSTSFLTNNNYLSGIARYKQYNDRVNITINETSSISHTINLSNNGIVTLSYNGRKDLRIVNSTITLNPIDSNYSAYWTHNSSVYANNFKNATITIPSNGALTVVKSSSSGGCDYPTVANYVGYNKLCDGIFYLNATSSASGVLTANADNTFIECGNTILIGNTTGKGAYNNKHGVTIANCTFLNYNQGIKDDISAENSYLYNNKINNSDICIYNVGVGNSTINGNIISNCTSGIQIYKSTRNGNYTVSNNIIYGNDGIIVREANIAWVYGNKIYSSSNDGISIVKTDNAFIYNNLLYNISDYSFYLYNSTLIEANNNNASLLYRDNSVYSSLVVNLSFHDNRIGNLNGSNNHLLRLDGNINATIKNNYFYNAAILSQFLNIVGSLLIDSNTFINADKAISFRGITNGVINSNTILNISKNSDGYNTGIHIWGNSSNISLNGNSIEYAHLGIYIQQSNNVSIYNTICNQISLIDILNGAMPNTRTNTQGYGVYQYNEPTACILAGEQYEGWLGDSSESMSDNITKFRTYNVTNLIINGITPNVNVQTYLHTVGVFGIQNYNLPTGYWYNKFWFIQDMTDLDEFYNNPNWNQLQVVPTNVSGISNIFWKNRAGMNNKAYTQGNYSISKSLMSFKNVNQTTAYNLSLFNLTINPQGYTCVQIFNGTSNLPWGGCGSAYNSYNETIGAGNRTMVFNTLNNLTPRLTGVDPNALITTFSTTSKQTIIVSTGAFNITNLDYHSGVYVYHDGVSLGYTNSKDYYADSSGNWEFSETVIVINQIQTQNCILSVSSIFDTTSFLPMMIVALMLVVILPIILLFWSAQQNNVNYIDVAKQSTGNIIMVSVAIIVVIILIIMSLALIAGIFGALC